MRIALIHPPLTLPTSMPIGISYLKAYIQKNLSGVEIKCFDLNLDWHRYFFKGFENKKRQSDEEKRIVELKSFFDKREILNRGKYNEKGVVFRNMFKGIYKQGDESYADILLGKKAPDDVLRKFAGMIIDYKPDIIGFSVGCNKQWHFASCLARGLRGQIDNVEIVFGGSFFAVDAEKKFSKSTMDYLIYGEGEVGFLQLLKKLKDCSNVASLVYEKNGKVKKNPPVVINNPDMIPFPDFSDLEINEYLNPVPVVPVLTSRGCYWQRCAFCIHHKAYHSFRVRTISNVIEEIKKYVSKGVRYFHFVDEMISAQRFRQLSEAIIREGLDIRYLALAKPLKEFDKDTVSLMYKSGCRMLVWGVESGSQRVLDKINKGTKVEEIKDALKNSSLAGIKNHIFVMIGFPGEYEEDFDKTVDFLFKNKEYIHSIHRGPFSLNSGSYVFKFPELFGITEINNKDIVRVEHGYVVKEGIDKNRAIELLFACNDFFNNFNPYSDVLNTFREHALYVYSNLKIDYSKRKIPSREDMQNTVSYDI